jgi:hypothetical protein
MLHQVAPLRTLLVTLAALAIAPCSTAFGVTATITGDGGEAVPLEGAGPTVRNIAPSLTFAFAADEARYSFSVTGPAGDEAAAPLACNSPGFATPEDINYRGNGVYTVSVLVSTNPDDATCAEATEHRFTFTINATTTVIPPPGVLMTAKTPTAALISYPFALQVVPGTGNYEMQYAVDAKLNADGSIAGEHSESKPDKEDGMDTLTFGKPGHYSFVARANSTRGVTPASTPWSAPVFVTVMAPFGVDTVLSNAHIHSVKITGNTTEETATGTMTASIAKGAKGKKFRKLATVKLGTASRFKLKFRVSKPGAYRIRYAYKGNATVIAGSATEVVRLKR